MQSSILCDAPTVIGHYSAELPKRVVLSTVESGLTVGRLLPLISAATRITDNSTRSHVPLNLTPPCTDRTMLVLCWVDVVSSHKKPDASLRSRRYSTVLVFPLPTSSALIELFRSAHGIRTPTLNLVSTSRDVHSCRPLALRTRDCHDGTNFPRFSHRQANRPPAPTEV